MIGQRQTVNTRQFAGIKRHIQRYMIVIDTKENKKRHGEKKYYAFRTTRILKPFPIRIN